MGGGLTDLTQHLHKSTPNSGTALTAADLARAENIDYECAKAFCMIYGFRMMRLWCIKHNDFRKYQCDGTIDEFVMEWMKKEGWQIDGVCDTRRTQT